MHKILFVFFLNVELKSADSCGASLTFDGCSINECNTLRDGNPEEDPCCDTATAIIRQSDLCPFYEITEPGTYRLAEPLELISPDADTSLIYISSSDVRLNLNGYTLYYLGSVSGTSGIRICRGVQNVKIYNGSIRKFTYGVTADTTSSIVNCNSTDYLTGNFISNISLTDLTTNANSSGIYLKGDNSNEIYSISLLNIVASNNTSNGVFFDNVKCSSIRGSTFNMNTGTGKTVSGLKLKDCHDLTVGSCKANCNKSDQDAYGIYVTGTTTSDSLGNTVTCCTTDMNETTATSSYQSAGIYFETSKNCTITSNRSSHNKSGYTSSSYGILMDSATIQCEVSCNELLENQIGIKDTDSTSIFKRNVGYKNIPDGSSPTVVANYKNFDVTFANQSGSGTSFDNIKKDVQLKDFSNIADVVSNTWLNISVTN